MTVTTTWNGGSNDYYSTNWSNGVVPYSETPSSVDAVIGSDSASPYTSGSAYVIDASNPSFGGNFYGSAADTLTLNDTSATLAVGSSNNFVLTTSLVFTAGTLTVGDTNGNPGALDFGSGVSTFGSDAFLSGYGSIQGEIAGNGTIEATGGGAATANGLYIISAVDSGGMVFQVAADSAIAFQDNVASDVTVDFLSNSGAVVLYDEPNSGNGAFEGTIYGLAELPNTGIDAPENYIVEGDLGDASDATFDTTTDQLITDEGTIYLAGTYVPGSVLQYQTDSVNGGYDFWLAVCFAEGTRILTDRGDVAVESLTESDTVITTDRGTTQASSVRWVGRRHLDLTTHPRAQHAAPVRIRRGAFAENQPHRDLLVSPDHCLFVDGKLIPAKLLINGMTIVQETAAKAVTYYHVELDRHAVLLAEGLPAESYLDTGNRAFFSNAGLALILHPEFHVNAGLKCWETDACAPLAVSEAAVRPIWTMLAARAQTLGFAQPDILTTDDADLRIVAAGRTFRPVSSNANRYVFVLPAGVTQADLVSRAGSPADVKPWLDDHRQLGVAVSRIVVRGGTDYADVAVDHPALRQGWHSVETEGRAMWRWTTGRAALPIQAATGPVTIEVHLRSTGTYVVATADTVRRLAA